MIKQALLDNIIQIAFTGLVLVVCICLCMVAVFIAAYWIKCLLKMTLAVDEEVKKNEP